MKSKLGNILEVSSFFCHLRCRFPLFRHVHQIDVRVSQKFSYNVWHSLWGSCTNLTSISSEKKVNLLPNMIGVWPSRSAWFISTRVSTFRRTLTTCPWPAIRAARRGVTSRWSPRSWNFSLDICLKSGTFSLGQCLDAGAEQRQKVHDHCMTQPRVLCVQTNPVGWHSEMDRRQGWRGCRHCQILQPQSELSHHWGQPDCWHQRPLVTTV